ncbi:MAG: UTP--glucose-1-phosphate uridylyltransferase [Phycisphaerae bacterium]
MSSTQARFDRYRTVLADAGQAHLLSFWSRLDTSQRGELLDDLDQVDFDRCTPLIDRYVRNRPRLELSGSITPADALPSEPDPAQADQYARAKSRGAELIAAGGVAAFTVAGGQGTRLGYDGPKGAFQISPIRNACLFQLFAEYLIRVGRRYGRRPRWYIMTSPANHAETLATFERGRFFGLDPDEVYFFPQRQMPAFTPEGRIAMTHPHRLALSPDGHGGSLHALHAGGALDDMRRRGIEQISYFQVDNPLVRCVDPLFVGLHVLAGSQMSSKAVRKRGAEERVGVFARVDGALSVIEYSDLPDQLAQARRPDGGLQFDAGSIAIHLLDRAFVEALTAPGAPRQLPWHRADKKVAIIDADGRIQSPTQPNVVKLETFVFDAIPMARNPIVVFTRREEEFSPVKNAEGEDSPTTTRRDLVRRAAAWLEACGARVPRDAAGEPALAIEISPSLAMDADDLRTQSKPLPALTAGKPALLI